jgi:hypothetical protein
MKDKEIKGFYPPVSDYRDTIALPEKEIPESNLPEP